MDKERNMQFIADTHHLMNVYNLNNGNDLYKVLCKAYERGVLDAQSALTKTEVKDGSE